MPNARVIKNRIKTVKNTGKITKTMAMVSTAKATKVVGLIKASRPYSKHLASFLKGLSRSCDGHPLFVSNESAEKRLLIVVTSNRGLCGGYNANLLKLAKEKASEEDSSIWMYGKKGISAFRFAGIEMEKTGTDLKDIPTFDEALELANAAVEAYEKGQFTRVDVVYSEFISAGQQKPLAETLLPMTAPDSEDGQDEYGVEPLYHPDKESLLKALLPKLIRLRFFKVLLDAAASEHLARQMAMSSASDNANDMVKSLSLSYNRARQAQITTELSEIVGGAEALN